MDVDCWPAEALQRLSEWASSKEYYGLAVSNPCFEFWLLLHFEEGQGAATATHIVNRLEKYSATKGKNLRREMFNEQRAVEAISLARARDTPPCTDWPRNAPGTTVYRLVEKFFAGDAH
ncbi:MAG: RloB family protein [Cyanobium sp.]